MTDNSNAPANIPPPQPIKLDPHHGVMVNGEYLTWSQYQLIPESIKAKPEFARALGAQGAQGTQMLQGAQGCSSWGY